jgi:hypothetical protein
MATSQYAHSEASLVQIEEMTKLSSQVHNALTGLIESNMQSADITVVSGLLVSNLFFQKTPNFEFTSTGICSRFCSGFLASSI